MTSFLQKKKKNIKQSILGPFAQNFEKFRQLCMNQLACDSFIDVIQDLNHN